MLPHSPNKEMKENVHQASSQLKPWVRKYARFGFMAKGTIFILVGIFSLLTACGYGSKAKGTNGAFHSVAAKPFGEVLLWIIGIGLIGYILWLLLEFFRGPSTKDKPLKRYGRKVASIIKCAIYIGLAANALSIAIHAGQSGNSKETWTARLLAASYGPWVVGIVGAIVLGVGVYHIYEGLTGSFISEFRTAEMSEPEVQAAISAGRIGLMSRGVVFIILGYFIVRMAITVNPNNPLSLDGALEKILEQRYGAWLLGAVSIGLAFYGLYEILKGKNKNIII
ncbi:DUF1206 domain-containing protein [Peribacillus sp. SCS-155]|uniref:DUF1206 domain-containing protein n=1 Tax=Peribacillus sedimenti TaxID=3115297 RepID=UPI0039059AFE